MSAYGQVAELKELEGVMRIDKTLYRQFIFQASRKTYYCCMPIQSIWNNTQWSEPIGKVANGNSGQYYLNVADLATWRTNDFRDSYIWGWENNMELQNHSGSEVKVTLHYAKFRNPIEVFANYPASINVVDPTDTGSLSLPLNIFYNMMGNSMEPEETIASYSGHHMLANDQYWMGGADADGILHDIGEGAGIAGVNDNPVCFTESALPEHGLSIARTFNLFDAVDYGKLVHVYKREKVLMPAGSCHFFSLKHKGLVQFGVAPGVGSNDAREAEFLNTFDPSLYHVNENTRFVIIEVEGSLMGGSVFTGTAADAATDTINMNSVLDDVGTHGGVMRIASKQRWYGGAFDRLAAETSYPWLATGQPTQQNYIPDPEFGFNTANDHYTGQ